MGAAAGLGRVAAASDLFPFEWTDYYEPAMGRGLVRRLFAYDGLADPGGLAAWKVAAIAVEAEVAAEERAAGREEPRRPVNLDPGYVADSKVVLASTKDFAHRIYLGQAIFAEVTLAYERGGARLRALPWTYPDWRSGRYDPFLREARELLRAARKKL